MICAQENKALQNCVYISWGICWITLFFYADGAGDGTETRVMIFSQLRDSVNEITEMLRRHRPVVRVMSFVGQSQGKVSKGFTQAEQLKVLLVTEIFDW